MNHINIITDLITWLEKNLEQPLSIDHVAKKSGYSKWHLQRMFKDVTGSVLGTYIRHRRLTHAALALKMTSKPILDIAMQYRFDSQQTFTRSFKKQYKLTPASYRRSEYWDPAGLTPPIQLHKTPLALPEPQFITLPSKTFWGVSYKNVCSLSELLSEKQQIRHQFFSNYMNKYIKNVNNLPSKVYAFSLPQPSKDSPDDQEVIYTIALEEKGNIEDMVAYHHQEGLYVCFKFIGHPDGFHDFVSQVYLSALPTLQVKRRSRSSDIEIHYKQDNWKNINERPDMVECDYFVPIVAQDELDIPS